MKSCMNEYEWAKIGSKMLLYVHEMGLPQNMKGSKAFFCIACVAVKRVSEGPLSWAMLAHEYGEYNGTTQMATWEAMRRALRKAGWPGTVGEALAAAVLEVANDGES